MIDCTGGSYHLAIESVSLRDRLYVQKTMCLGNEDSSPAVIACLEVTAGEKVLTRVAG